MALQPVISLGQSLATGTILRFNDTTGDYVAVTNVGGYNTPNIARSDVKMVRLVWGNNVAELAAGDVTELTAYFEYIITAGTSVVYSGRSLAIGDVFIASSTTFPTGTGVTVSSTGRYCQPTLPATYLPTADDLNLDLAPDDVGLDSDLTVFTDLVYDGQYDVFGGSAINTLGSLVNGTQYIVRGTALTDAIVVTTINGAAPGAGTYYAGDVITAPASGVVVFTGGTGSIYLVEYKGSVTKTFAMYYYSNSYITYIQDKIRASQTCLCSEELFWYLVKMNVLLQGIIDNTSPVDLEITDTQSMIDTILELYNQAVNCDCE